MSQLTVYIDDKTREKIEVAARQAEISVSQWVKNRLSTALETEWPQGYFEVLGSLDDGDLERPPGPPREDDIVRGSL